ncbi:SDR family oxidoreductase [Deinococcus sp.]|uniref:SDR family oxidoreductase n=1 Tax=Deinococcus sp. TaxID=47478 RepID=UPI003CC5754B
MKVLFIGGTGIISSACTQVALESGLEVYLLNRGQSPRPVVAGAQVLHGDLRDPASLATALGDHSFDAVVNWIAFTPAHIEADLATFRERTGQYVFISSASAYQTPPASLPILESTPLSNPFWQYSRDKIACEECLTRAYRDEGFPVTIVRPSHTYDRTLLPMDGGYTVINRMRQGKRVIVHGDGTSLWTLTHHHDFARGFVPLLGNPHALGEVFHITSDELLSWNQIFQVVAQAAGTRASAVHLPSDLIAAHDPEWGAGLLGDKAHSMIFDNSKIKRFVPGFRATIPFFQGAREIMAWYDADPARQVVNQALDHTMDELLAIYDRALP